MSYYPDSEARTDPRLLLIQRAERGAAARARQSQRWRRIATVAIIAIALLAVPFAARSWAWTAAISGKGVCNTQTGQYDLVWTLDNTSEPEPATVTGDLTATVPAHGTETVSESVPGSTSSVSRTVRINWPSDQANLKRTGTVELTGDCKKPTPPPPAKQGSAGVSTTCDSVTFNFTSASAGVSQYAKVDGKIKRPASLNGSVTFKGLAPGEHPSEYGSGTNVQRGSFEALDCKPAEKKGDDFAGTATDLHRATPPDQHGPPPKLEQLPPVKQPGTGTGQLPFTGPREWLLPLGLTLFVAGAAMVLAGRRTHQRMLRSIEPSQGVREWSLDRDSADTNLLMTLFHRFHR